MSIYISMIAWVLVTGLLFYKEKSYYRKENGTLALVADAYPYIAMAYIIFFAGLRSGVADTPAYIYAFNNMPTGMVNAKEIIAGDFNGWLFTYLELFIKTYISKDFHVFLFIVAAFEGLLMAYGISKFSKYSRESMILFMLAGIYTWMFNGIRQLISIALIFAGLDLLVHKKRFKYILLVLFAMCFHVTAVIMLPMCFLVDGKPWNKKTVFILIAAVAVIFFATEFTNILGGALEGTSMEGATEQFAQDDGVTPLRVLANSVPAIIAFINRKTIEKINSRTLNTLVNLSIMTVGMSLVAMVTSGILIGRLVIYFNIFNLILLPWLLNETFGKNKKLGKFAAYVFYLLWFYLENLEFYVSDILNIYIW